MDENACKEKLNRDRSASTEGRKSRSTSKSKKRKYNKRTGSTDSSSSSDDQLVKRKDKKREKSRKRKKRRHRSSSSDPSADRKSEKRKKKRKKKKSEKHKRRKREKIEVEGEVNKPSINPSVVAEPEPMQTIGPALELDSQSRKSMKPMTKEEWEKQQSIVRRVMDPETGRQRLIKGDGEVLEEIVSRDRQREINKQATLGDGLSFQAQVGLLKK